METKPIKTVVAFVQTGYEKIFVEAVEHLREFVQSRGHRLEMRFLDFDTPSQAAHPAKLLRKHEYPVVLVGNGFGAIGALVLLAVAEVGVIVHSVRKTNMDHLKTSTFIAALHEQNLVDFFHLHDLPAATGFLEQLIQA